MALSQRLAVPSRLIAHARPPRSAYTIQHGVLSELDANGIACPVSASQSLSACLKAKGATIDANTVFRTFTKTVKEGGLYWDIHLQKQFSSKSVTVESKGDDYLLP